MTIDVSDLRKLAVAMVVAGSAVVPGVAAAQGGVNLVPWVGAYIPTSNSFTDSDIFRRDVSVIGGLRLTFWGSGRLGFEVGGAYGPAKIANETLNETGNSDLLLANARLLFALTPVTNPVGFYLGAGGALLTRGSDPFDDDRSGTDFGGTIGLGTRIRLGETSRVGLRIDLEDYLYNGDFGGDDDFQNDLVLSAGISIPIGGTPE